MKIKKRLIISFFLVILVPIALVVTAVTVILKYQSSEIHEKYGLEENPFTMIMNPTQILSRMTDEVYSEIKKDVLMNPDRLENVAYVQSLNERLGERYSSLVLKKDEQYIFIGDQTKFEATEKVFPKFGEYIGDEDSGYYSAGEHPYLIKWQNFYFGDGAQGSVFIITETNNLIPQMQSALGQLLLAVVLTLCLTAGLLVVWIHRGLVRPLNILRKATNRMIEGDLNYSIMPELKEELTRQQLIHSKLCHFFRRKNQEKEACEPYVRDEISLLCLDFEKMRLQMQESMQKRVKFEEDQRELISNISHDLKTPLTAIKGYTEGIIDGVAETPEKRERYLKTIYTKANDMTALVDELSFYSKIDCNTIPYEFAEIDAKEYFRDCVSDIGLDLEVKGINLAYFYYIEDSVKIVADAEKLKRVINNVIGNSVKYMDRSKGKGSINIRLKDQGEFILVEMEDNGRGIPQKDVNNIFDRFYRSDASRNSKKGGSGLGLAISRKIIEDHGGKIWAESQEEVGTIIYFTLCKSRPNMVMSVQEQVEDAVEQDENRRKGWRLRRGKAAGEV